MTCFPFDKLLAFLGIKDAFEIKIDAHGCRQILVEGRANPNINKISECECIK